MSTSSVFFMHEQRPPSRRRTKRFGQNFLVESNIARRIVELANLDPNLDVVVEIGSGTGNLTQFLTTHAKQVIAIEVDPALVKQTKETCRNASNLTVIEGDVLKVEFPPCTKVVSNLPYAISSPVSFYLISNREKWTECILMFQKEFAERLYAPPGSGEYSRLSAGVQYFLEVEKLMTVSRRNFTPQPKVDSTVVKFTHKQTRPILLPETYLELTRGIFPYKNRTLRNALQIMLKSRQISSERINNELNLGDLAERRVRTLTPSEIESLALKLEKNGWIPLRRS